MPGAQQEPWLWTDDGLPPRLPCPGSDSLTAESERELPSQRRTPVQRKLLPTRVLWEHLRSLGGPTQGTPNSSELPPTTQNTSYTAGTTPMVFAGYLAESRGWRGLSIQGHGNSQTHPGAGSWPELVPDPRFSSWSRLPTCAPSSPPLPFTAEAAATQDP